MDAVVTGLFQPIGEQGAPPAAAFSRPSTPIAASGVSIYGYTAERCACGYGGPGRERKAENHRDAYSIQRGNCSTDTAYQGEIVILPSDSVRLNDVLGDQTGPRKRWREDPSHAADDDCAENGSAKRTAAGRSYATCGY